MSAAIASDAKPNLSCMQCQQRKRKCDKVSPTCGTCKQSGTTCTVVSRARLPRGRHANSRDGDDLRRRVAKLEALLTTYVNNGAAETKEVKNKSLVQKQEWTSLTEEVVGLQEILDRLILDEPTNFDETQLTTKGNVNIASSLLSSSHLQDMHQPPWLFSTQMATPLLELYLDRFDPIFKVAHAPTLRRLMLQDNSGDLASETLKLCVLFGAVNTIDDQECLQLFNSTKSVLNDQFQLAAEKSLSKAQVFTTTSLTIVQAFVIYLAALRSRKGSRSVLALIGSAVRLGQALGLDTVATSSTPYETEMRRRIWYGIGILDVQAAFDGGSYIVLAGGALFRAPPAHIDDADISPGDPTPISSRNRLTDMTFSSLTHETLRHMRRLIHVPTDVDGVPIIQQDWSKRYAIAAECEHILREKYISYCTDDSDLLQRFIRVCAESMITTIRIVVRRPMNRFYSSGPPADDEYDVLNVTVQTLEESNVKYQNQAFKRWGWFAWTKWYNLAIVLAELCKHTQGPHIDRAWLSAEVFYEIYKKQESDPRISTSMERLLGKARLARSSSFAPLPHEIVCSENNGLDLSLDDTATNNYPANNVSPHDSGYGGSLQTDFTQELDMMSWDNWEAFVGDFVASGPYEESAMI